MDGTPLKYPAVLFDLDGTLLDTLEDLGAAVNEGLLSLGFPVHPLSAIRDYVGEGREELARKALPEGRRSPDMVRQLVDFFDAYYAVHWADHTRPYAGIPELLDALTDRGTCLTVFSNKPHQFTVENVSGLLHRWHFAAVLGASETNPKKPDPAVPRRIAEGLQMPTSAFLYLGDSGLDMRTAVSAGMFPVGALWGFRDAADLRSGGARVLIQNPAQLLEFLD